MPKFRVRTPILMDGKRFEPGDMIELNEQLAGQMPWAVEPAPPEPEAPESKKKEEKGKPEKK
jgi:hypothetical protein